MDDQSSEQMYGRRRAMSASEREKLEQYVIRMKRRGYSEQVISQSVSLSPTGVRGMVKRLRAAGVEGI